jgi:hypothetical protein
MTPQQEMRPPESSEFREGSCGLSKSAGIGGDGKPALGVKYAVSAVLHSETVLRRFYELHRDGGDGPLLNPFPSAESRRGRRGAHRSPMMPRQVGRVVLYRPTMPVRVPRSIPDGCCRPTATVKRQWPRLSAVSRNHDKRLTGDPEHRHRHERGGPVRRVVGHRLR